MCKGQCITIEVLTYFFGHSEALRVSDGSELLLFQLFNGVLVISQIKLSPNENYGSVGAMMSDLWIPLLKKKRKVKTHMSSFH